MSEPQPVSKRPSNFFFSTTDHGPSHSKAIAQIVPSSDPGAKPPKGREFVKVYLTSREPIPQGLKDPHKKKSASSKSTSSSKLSKSSKSKAVPAAAPTASARSALLGVPPTPSPPSSSGGLLASSISGKSNFRLDDENVKFSPAFVCQQDGNSSRYYLSGASLSGKSFTSSMLAKSYASQFPNRKIVIFSADHEDPSYASLSKFCEVVRVPLERGVIIGDSPIELEELKGTSEGGLIIFDDFQCADKEVNKALETLKDACLNRGRHFGLSTMIARQIALQGHITRAELTNSLACVFYPQSGGRKAYMNYLKTYMGLSTNEIRRVTREVGQSRWVLISRSAPIYLLHEKGVFMLDDNDSDSD